MTLEVLADLVERRARELAVKDGYRYREIRVAI